MDFREHPFHALTRVNRLPTEHHVMSPHVYQDGVVDNHPKHQS